MSFESSIAKFASELSQLTGERKPVVKIQVSPKVFDQIIGKMHESLLWADDGKEILSFEIYGIGFTK